MRRDVPRKPIRRLLSGRTMATQCGSGAQGDDKAPGVTDQNFQLSPSYRDQPDLPDTLSLLGRRLRQRSGAEAREAIKADCSAEAAAFSQK